MSNPQTTKPDLKTWLREEIELHCADIDEIRRSAEEGYDPNSYGAGYDAGELNGLKLVLSFMEMNND